MHFERNQLFTKNCPCFTAKNCHDFYFECLAMKNYEESLSLERFLFPSGRFKGVSGFSNR
jgi:hypothetical protein